MESEEWRVELSARQLEQVFECRALLPIAYCLLPPDINRRYPLSTSDISPNQKTADIRRFLGSYC